MHLITISKETWDAIAADLRDLSMRAGGLPMPAYKRRQAQLLNDRLEAEGKEPIEGVVQGWQTTADMPDRIQLRIGQ